MIGLEGGSFLMFAVSMFSFSPCWKTIYRSLNSVFRDKLDIWWLRFPTDKKITEQNQSKSFKSLNKLYRLEFLIYNCCARPAPVLFIFLCDAGIQDINKGHRYPLTEIPLLNLETSYAAKQWM